MMKKLLLALCFLLTLVGAADAHPHAVHRRNPTGLFPSYSYSWNTWAPSAKTEVKHVVKHVRKFVHRIRSVHRHPVSQPPENVIGNRPSNCFGIPWCGCWMRTQVSNDPGPAFNLAANWAHWGKPSSLLPGAIVVHPHHVDMVVDTLGDGRYLARGGNVRHDNYAHTYVNTTRGSIAIRIE